MRNVMRVVVVAAMLCGTAAPLVAATPSEFYTALLRRGVASFDASRYSDAAKQLRIAAFGLVDAIDQYQTAQIYLALTLDRLGETDRAREAAHRVVVAERVERRFGSLTLPAGVRSGFDALSTRLLSTTEVGVLRSAASSTNNAPRTETITVPMPSQPATTKPAPAQTTPITTTKPPASSNTNGSTTTSKPATSTTAPNTTTSKPAPSTTTPNNTTSKPAPSTTAPNNTTPNNTTTSKPATSTTTPNTTSSKPATSTTTTNTPSKPAPSSTTTAPSTSTTKPATTPTTKPATMPATTTPAPATTAPRALTASEVLSRLANAERALNGGNLTEARRVYREVLGTSTLDHETLIRIAEGLYRSRDFSGALAAFNRIGTLRRGEEPYRYYIAVASYETGDYARAKKELAAALPFIEITPDVARYRAKIESSL